MGASGRPLHQRNFVVREAVQFVHQRVNRAVNILDPPFNSARSYNVLFKDESGRDSDAQITAFDDTWHWGEAAERTFDELITDAPERVSAAIAKYGTVHPTAGGVRGNGIGAG